MRRVAAGFITRILTPCACASRWWCCAGLTEFHCRGRSPFLVAACSANADQPAGLRALALPHQYVDRPLASPRR